MANTIWNTFTELFPEREKPLVSEVPGASWGDPGASWGRPGGVLRRSWGTPGESWALSDEIPENATKKLNNP